jgi:hypothetical protein
MGQRYQRATCAMQVCHSHKNRERFFGMPNGSHGLPPPRPQSICNFTTRGMRILSPARTVRSPQVAPWLSAGPSSVHLAYPLPDAQAASPIIPLFIASARHTRPLARAARRRPRLRRRWSRPQKACAARCLQVSNADDRRRNASPNRVIATPAPAFAGKLLCAASTLCLFLEVKERRGWPGTSPAMTECYFNVVFAVAHDSPPSHPQRCGACRCGNDISARLARCRFATTTKNDSAF